QRTLESADRKDLGLETPRATIELTTAKGKTVLEVGSELPASSAMAVAVAGSQGAVVRPNSVYHDLTQGPRDRASHELVARPREDSARGTLSAAGQRVLLAKRGEEYWLESPLTDRADRDATGRLLSDLTGFRATNFLDTPDKTPAQMGLEPPQGVVEVVLTGK